MKQLILVRHAKSDWGNPALDDIDRPLNERGKKDAPMMAQRLLDKKVKIDAFFSSPAKRAAKTAKIFAEAYQQKKGDITFKEKLYLAEPESIMSVVLADNDKIKTKPFFCQNFGIPHFTNLLAIFWVVGGKGSVIPGRILKLPTRNSGSSIIPKRGNRNEITAGTFSTG